MRTRDTTDVLSMALDEQRSFDSASSAGGAEGESQPFPVQDEERLSRRRQLSAAQRHQLLIEHNDTDDPDEPQDATLWGLFAAQAARSPDAVAVVWLAGDGVEERLSYGELARRAGVLAARLVALGVGLESRVGVCVGRSPVLVEVLLGVLAAGGAYVALDPAYPEARLAAILEDAQRGLAAAVVVSEPRWRERLPAASLARSRVLWLDRELRVGEISREALPVLAAPESLAYVLFTSGSTGRPKGVAIAQRSALALIRWAQGVFSPRELGGVLATTSINFDLSVFELFVPLSLGGTVMLLENALSLATLSAREREPLAAARLLNTVPSAATELLRLGALPGGLEIINLAGEPLRQPLVRELLTRPGMRRVLDLYGPSEDTTYSTWSRRRADGPETIGRPIAGTRAYVVDRFLRLVAFGEVGELCLAGAGLARGYLLRPGLSAESFVPEPWSGAPGARLYRTGDLARFLASGELQYLGRRDHQVKIRGFRVELGEIEHRLLADRRVREAVVVVRDGGLVAYTLGASEELDGEELRQSLERSLPAYMVPSQVVVREELPRRENGKLDRQALARLPLPARSLLETRGPEGPEEELVAEIFVEVLGVDGVGRDESFFALGGHSLLAAQVIARLLARCSVEISLPRFFAMPTVAALAGAIRAGEGAGIDLPPLRRSQQDGERQLSFAQERLWFLDQFLEQREMYNIPWPLALSGRLEPALLAASLTEVARRHEILRTIYVAHGGHPRQRVLASLEVPLPIVDLSGLAVTAKEAARLFAADARRPFSLTRGPVLRATLLRLGATEHHLLLHMHHIASDGWSLGILERELGLLYAAGLAGQVSPLAELTVQYADHGAWQRQWLSDDLLTSQIAFWRQELAGAPAALGLPFDRPRSAGRPSWGGFVEETLPVADRASLERLAASVDATLFMALLASWQVLLRQVSGETDVSVGVPVAGRRHVESEDLIGFFVNTLVLRCELAGDPGWPQVMVQARRRSLAALAHQDVPFERLVQELAPDRAAGTSALFQVMFVLHHAWPEPAWPGLSIRRLAAPVETTKFALSLVCTTSENGVRAVLEYDRSLFDRTTAHRLLGRWRRLLRAIAAEPRAPLSWLSQLSALERHQILVEWNEGANERPGESTLSELFAIQAAHSPDKVAVVWLAGEGVEERLSYGELAHRAGVLAARLAALGIGLESRVGVCVGRSPVLVEVLLGVLAAGGAYVALDPAYPEERLEVILEDAQRGQDAPVVISEQRWRERLPAASLARSTVLWLDREPGVDDTPDVAPAVAASPESLAYVLYTSGSTGRPKGVAIAQCSTVALIRWARGVFSPRELSGMLAATSINFDLSVFELFVPLSSGGTVILLDNVLALATLSAAERAPLAAARLLNTVPSAAVELLRLGALPPSLATINLAGEPLRQSLVRELVVQPGIERVFDLYGPSEDTTYSTWSRRRADGPETIGRPIAGTRAYVVNRFLRPVALGEVGELCLAGAGLARGYLLRPGLTAEKFVPEPWSSAAGGRLYRTGDLARFLASGDLQYLGRRDHQVKVRGFRVELGEIEQRLLTDRRIHEAVAVARDDRLVAYALGDSEQLDGEELRQGLARSLPPYMVPSQVAVREELPRRENGKLDRQALARLSLPARSQLEARGPEGPEEELVAEIFGEVLGVEGVGRDESFFALGGHSLLAAQVIVRLLARCFVEISLARFFAMPTVAALAGAIRAGEGAGIDLPPLRRSQQDGERQLSFAQERLWFLDQLMTGGAMYHLPWPLRLRGPLDVAALAASLGAVIRRHEVLRTTYDGGAADGPRQVIHPPGRVVLPCVDLSGLAEPEPEAARLRCEDVYRPFDLAKGPVLRATLLQLSRHEHDLLLTMHHIASDGWSLGILARELGSFYRAALDSQPAVLAKLPVQYGDYAGWQRQWLKGELLESQIAFFRQALADAPTLLELPTDRPRPAVASFRGAEVCRVLPRAQISALAELGQPSGGTLFMVLLTAFAVLLTRLSGQRDLCIGTPVAGRSNQELEGLIGFFINTLVLRSRLTSSSTWESFFAAARQEVLAALAHQDVPFERLVEELQPQRSLGHTPLFQVMLVLQNTPSDLAAWGELELEPLPVAVEREPFDLTLAGEETLRGFELRLAYSSDLFDRTTVQRWLATLVTLLDRVTACDPRAPLRELELVTPGERAQLLSELSWTAAVADPRASAVYPLIRAQAERTPARIAAVAGKEAFSYQALATAVEGLAAELRSGPEEVVALAVEPSLELLVGILAIWRAGGVYLPLDPALPRQRRRFMIEDARVEVMLGSAARIAELATDEAPRTVVLDVARHLRSEQPACFDLGPLGEPSGEALAYIIYTSGSTGRPKGVGVGQRALAWHSHLMARMFGLGDGDAMVQFSSPSFDASLEDFLPPLVTGARVVFQPTERLTEEQFLPWLVRERLSVAYLPVVFWQRLTKVWAARPRLTAGHGLRLLMVGGEAMPTESVRRFVALAGPLPLLVNTYGPTEGVITATWGKVFPALVEAWPWSSVAIGRPLPARSARVLDPWLRASPLGVAGELALGGLALARGYLGRPSSTAAKFVPDSSGEAIGGRLYLTGDRVRWHATHGLEFLGRTDQQVKLRGYRIELGEIETALGEHPAIEQAIVRVVRDPRGADQLVAHLVRSATAAPLAGELRRFLASRLPESMLPAVYVELEAWPLTAGGKVDLRALPAPDWGAAAETTRPRTAVEEIVAGIWSEVLAVDGEAISGMGPRSEFFALGGHSLLATQVMARISKLLGVELPVRTLFAAPTLTAFAEVVAEALTRSSTEAPPPPLVRIARKGVRIARKGQLEPSYAQERLWLIDQLQVEKGVYNIPWPVAISGELEVPALRFALAEVVRRHEVLRTVYPAVEGRPVPRIEPLADQLLTVVDLSALDAPEKEAKRLRAAEGWRAFDLLRGPVFRATLICLAAREHQLLFTVHHIASDGWSMAILGRELGALYGAAVAAEPSPLAALAVTYIDYAAWQRRWLRDEVLAAQLDYWRTELGEAPPLLELPTDRPRPAVAGFDGALAVRTLPSPLLLAARSLARQTGSTLYMVLLAAFHGLLARHSGQTQVSVGTPVTGRRQVELEALIGLFVNTLVLSVRLEPTLTFARLVARIRRQVLDALAHQDLPFERLVEELQPRRSLSYAPLFQVMFVAEGEEQAALADWGALRVRELSLDDEPAKFDLILSCQEVDQELRCTLSYNRDLFDATTVKRLLARFALLLAESVADRDRQLAALTLQSPAERHQLLMEWNDRDVVFPGHLTVPEIFAAVADQRPEAVAVVATSDGSCLSYDELERRSSGVAWTLIDRGVGPESLIGLDVERTPAAVAAILGILESGAAYVPLDRDYPAERLRFMIEDTGLELLLSDAEEGDSGASSWSELELEVLTRNGEPGWGRPSPHRPRPMAGAENLAYVMYTSGSTGRPKGVGVTHRNILRLVLGASYVELGSDVTVLQLAPISFDASTFELWAPLLNGGRLAVFPSGPLSLAELGDALANERVDTLWLTAGLFHQVVEERPRMLTPVRQLLAGGDVLSPEAVTRVLVRQPSTTLVNGYGPTETTTFACCHPMRSLRQVGGTVSIGGPIDNARVHVLDQRLAAQPLGVIGELWIAGAGVSRGYFGQPRGTAERFLPELEAPAPGGRMYRTGDQARWLASGCLEFLGRGDSQVKIRGFRVELGEIEAHLAEHPELGQVLVLAREDAFGSGSVERHLVAYGVPVAKARPTAKELQDFLARRLPRHMVPSAFVLLDAFPLGPTGKVDRRALPRPDRGDGDAGYVAPRGAVEEGLATIWQEVLGVPRIGSQDDFFVLGGHSLLASRMMARIEARFGRRLSLRQLFLAPTIAGLAPHLEEAFAAAFALPLVPLTPDERRTLSFAQERLWFLDRLQPGKASYTIPWPLALDGPLDAAALAWSLREILRRHQVLRTVFGVEDARPVPAIQELGEEILAAVDLSALKVPVEEARRLQEADALRPIDLARGPLLRATLLRLMPNRHHLLLNVHHIASDGWSMDLLERELSALYAARVAGRESPLVEPPIQYADFAAWQRRALTGEALERGIAHGRESLAGAPSQLTLPSDRPRPPILSDRGADLSLGLDPDLVSHFKEVLAELGVTPFIGLFAIFAALLSRHSGQSDVVVGAPIAGRHHLLLEDLIGLFLNNLALRARLDGEPSFRELSLRLREIVLGAHQHQEVPFEKLVEDLQPQRALNVNPIFQVLLNVHNWGAPRKGDSGLALPGVDVRRLEALGEQQSKFDLTLHVLEDGAGMTLFWLYHTDLFDPTTIARLAAHFVTLLRAGVARPDVSLAGLSCLSDAECQQILREWNDTASGFLPMARLHDGFIRRAEQQPDALALILGDGALSYRELARRSGSLAGRLYSLGVGAEARVGLSVDRSFEMVIAVLAVLRAGGAYVPLDPQLPTERLSLMLADSKAAVLLYDRALGARLPSFDGPHGFGGQLCEVQERAPNPVTVPPDIAAENLAYVIYTSGTTGRPKGVMCRHCGAVSYLRFMWQAFDLAPGDRTLQLASLAFDPSVRELFGPLGAGATVVLVAAEERRDPMAIMRRLGEQRITHLLSMVPSLLRLLPAAGEPFPALRSVMTNGERLLVSDVLLAHRILGDHVAVVNQYGPTECTMVAAFHRATLTAQPAGHDVVLVGRPILGRRIHLVDRRLWLVPVGVLGELCVATPDLARGYLDRPRQTAESFLPDPFAAAAGSRLYATGDLGRQLPDGRIEFVGRRDHQVKVLGQRVELGEIEAVLLRQPAVSGAVVVAWQPSSQEVRLVAYIESRDDQLRSRDLRHALQEILPEVMVPSAWVILDRLPLNPNGKVDRRALPDPATAEVGRAGAFVAPRSMVEELLAALWSDILEVGRIGVHDHFFALGGHSLAAIRLVYRLQEFLGIDVEVRTVFEAQTLEELTVRVEKTLLTKLEGLSEDAAREALLALRPDGSVPWRAKDDASEHLSSSLGSRLLTLTAAHQDLRAAWLSQAREQSGGERGIPRRPDRCRAPLSWMQESFWMIEQFEQGEISVYRSNHRLLFTDRIDIPALRRSFTKMVERHEILRTRFDQDEEDQICQEILPRLTVVLPIVDLTGLPPEVREGEEQRVLMARSRIRLDLRQAPVWRLLVVLLTSEEGSLLVSMHHIINDFWSMDRIFFPELAACYRAYARQVEPHLEELPIQYGDYAQWERDRLSDDVMEKLLVYWGEKMAGGIPQLELHTDRPRPETPRFRGALLSFALSPELTESLVERGREAEASPFMIALAAYKLLLHRYSSQEDILVGSPSANRFRVQTEKLCGCFVNMLLLRTSLAGDPTLHELVARVRETVLGAFSHQEMPFMALLGSFPPPDFAFDRPPFQAQFIFLNAATAASSTADAPFAEVETVDRGATDQDLALWLLQADRLYGTLIYDTDLFDETTAQRMIADYQHLLEAICRSPQLRLSSLERRRHEQGSRKGEAMLASLASSSNTKT